jgi:hypothetical protein
MRAMTLAIAEVQPAGRTRSGFAEHQSINQNKEPNEGYENQYGPAHRADLPRGLAHGPDRLSGFEE